MNWKHMHSILLVSYSNMNITCNDRMFGHCAYCNIITEHDVNGKFL